MDEAPIPLVPLPPPESPQTRYVPYLLVALLIVAAGGATYWLIPTIPALSISGRAGQGELATTTPATAIASSTLDVAYMLAHGLLVMDDVSAPGTPLAKSSIYSVHADGTGKKALAGPGNQYPSWTPDGRIIFVSNRTGAPQIWAMNADGSNAGQIGDISRVGGGEIVRVQMAGNGLIAFQHSGDGIWLMQKDGTGLRELVKYQYGGDAPSLARSGAWLTYTGGTGAGHNEIFRINTDGTGGKQLTYPTDPKYPDGNASSISPDETMIAIYTGTESHPADSTVTAGGVNTFNTEYHNIALLPATGGPLKILTACHPVFSLDELVRMGKADPNDPATCNTSDNPSWSPDGEWVIYDRGSAAPGGIGTWAISTSSGHLERLSPSFAGGGSVPFTYAK